MFKRLGGLKFSVMSPEQIRKLSVLEIKSPDLYDKDGFPVEGGLMDPHLGVVERGRRCKTCGQTMDRCTGHFGHIELVRPVIHVGFFKKVDLLLTIVCNDCSKLILTDDEISSVAKQKKKEEFYSALQTRGRAKPVCPHCGAKKAKIKLDPPTNFYIENAEVEGGFAKMYPNEIREIFEKVKNDDLQKIGFNVRPENFILTALPIPPVNMHPSITLDNGIKSEDDLTFKLVDIVVTNKRLKDNINAGTPQLIIEDLWNLLQYNVTTYFNNNTPAVPPAKHRSGRVLRTIVQRIKGKSGIIRNNLMGKRVNYAARATISPDLFISVDELGVPEYVADSLTKRIKITDYNKEECVNLVKNTSLVEYLVKPSGARKKITDANKEALLAEVEVGCAIERKLQNGDLVLFNRQPSLHRSSVMAHKVRITKGDTFRLNPTVCKPYNADYDGDEMNMHVPQSEEGIVESKELISVDKQIVSPRYGAPVITMQEDSISGAFLLTLDSTKIPRDMAMKYFQIIGLEEAPKPDLENNVYSGKLIFSLLLPKDISMKYNTMLNNFLDTTEKNSTPYKNLKKDVALEIENGTLKSGVIDKTSLGEGVAKLVTEIYDKYDGDTVIKFYNNLNKISIDLITKLGLSVGLTEYEPSETLLEDKKEVFDKFFDETKKIEAKYKDGTLEKIPGKSYDDSFETYMVGRASDAKKKIEKIIVKEKITTLFDEKPKYNSLVMILSGARGKTSNLTNIVGLWGQCAVREKRPSRGYTGRVLSTHKRHDLGALAKGFVTKSFYEGLSSRELYFHAMGGRQGEVDTGVSTKTSGYFYRRVSNALRDVLVMPDYSVRTSDNKMIQFKYGEDGIYPQKTYLGNPLYDARLENIYREVKKS